LYFGDAFDVNIKTSITNFLGYLNFNIKICFGFSILDLEFIQVASSFNWTIF